MTTIDWDAQKKALDGLAAGIVSALKQRGVIVNAGVGYGTHTIGIYSGDNDPLLVLEFGVGELHDMLSKPRMWDKIAADKVSEFVEDYIASLQIIERQWGESYESFEIPSTLTIGGAKQQRNI